MPILYDKEREDMNGIYMIRVILRSILAVLTIQILTRINGAKQISQLSFYDYITGITIGSLAAYLAVDEQIPLWIPITAITVFVSAAYLESHLTLRFLTIRKYIDGMPTMLMADGKLLQRRMKKARLTVNDLLSEARVAGYFDLSQIAYAFMENSGKISFLPYPNHQPIQTDLYISVIIDGEILDQGLAFLRRDITWLFQKLEEEQICLSDILLAIVDQSGNIRWYRRNETIEPSQLFI